MKTCICKIAVAALFGCAAASAQADASVGKPVNLFVGCDDTGGCSITLDEQGNISTAFNGFFGPYFVTAFQIAPTVNPLFVDNLGRPLEVFSYEVVGHAEGPFGRIEIELQSGALGLCDSGVTADGVACTGPNGDVKGDVLVFTRTGVDGNGDGHTRIDLLSDVGSNFTFATDFNVLEVGPEGANGAVHQAFGTDNAEQMTYNITSDTGNDDSSVPEPGSIALVGLGLAGLAARRRRAAGRVSDAVA